MILCFGILDITALHCSLPLSWLQLLEISVFGILFTFWVMGFLIYEQKLGSFFLPRGTGIKFLRLKHEPHCGDPVSCKCSCLVFARVVLKFLQCFFQRLLQPELVHGIKQATRSWSARAQAIGFAMEIPVPSRFWHLILVIKRGGPNSSAHFPDTPTVSPMLSAYKL